MVIFINQIRLKIGVMFGVRNHRRQCPQILRPVRLDIRRIGAIKDREEVVGRPG
jgi:RecA/RadA recombinase